MTASDSEFGGLREASRRHDMELLEFKREMAEVRAQVAAGFTAGDQRMTRIETSLNENTRTTNSVQGDTREIVELLKGTKIWTKVFLWLCGLTGAGLGVFKALQALRG